MRRIILAGIALTAIASKNLAQTATPAPTGPHAEGDAIVTAPVSSVWAVAYPGASADLTAVNADGLNNQQKMLAGLPPDNQSVTPSSVPTVFGVESSTRSTVAQKQQQLHEQAAAYRTALAQRQADLERRAAAAHIPMKIDVGGGKVGTLVDIDDNGNPTYVRPNDIYGASTIMADNLWPTNSVTAVAGWIAGQSGLNLTGTNQLMGMWEADYTANSAGVETNHDQFFDPSLGLSRVNQGDAGLTGLSPHATAVAGVLASGGISEFFNLSSLFGPSATNVDMGNYSRGMGFAGIVDAWSLQNYQGNFLDEAGNGLALANNSWGQVAGWVQAGTNWYWFGGSNTNQTDWQFGAYVGSYTGLEGGNAPRQLDSLSYQSPNTLIFFASGNDRNMGPGHATNYFLGPNGTIVQTATKNWLDGDAGGFRTVTPSQSAKNVLTVGSVNAIFPPGYTNATGVTNSFFSSVGPTTDGRIKPEVVAAGSLSSGTNAYNPFGFPGLVTPWWDPSFPTLTSDYAWVAGTSFSSPEVAAGLGLIMEERLNVQPQWANNGFPLLSSTLRALAVHTADQAGTNAGPSYTYGYGVFDAQNAATLVIADAITATNSANGFKPYVKEVFLPTGQAIQFNIYATNSSVPLKATLAWVDPQGPAQSNNVVNDPKPRLVNDLDLRIYPPGTTTFDPNSTNAFKPWILNPDLTNLTVTARSAAATTGDDSRNNLEQVVVNSPLLGTNNNYIVRVTYKGTLKDNSGSAADGQWASIILSGNLSTALPFVITGFFQQPDGQFIITWNAVVGGEYIVQGSSDLVNWTDLTGYINANYEAMSELVNPNGPYFFYRIARSY